MIRNFILATAAFTLTTVVIVGTGMQGSAFLG